MSTLYSWIGHQDFNAILSGNPKDCAIGSIVQNGNYDRLILIANYKADSETDSATAAKDVEKLVQQIKSFSNAQIITNLVQLDNPTLFADVYTATRDVLIEYPPDPFDAVINDFNVTSGTPTMQMVWLLLSKTLSCRTLSSSAESGVMVQDFPFEIEAEFIPDETKQEIVQRALAEQKKFLDEVRIDQLSNYGDLRFSSPAMISMYNSSVKAGAHSLPVCIVGEPGTEKKAIAELIHDESDFGNGQFMDFDCGSANKYELHEILFSEKFPEHSLISKASNGTLYLSNIENLGAITQRKITRLLTIHENLDTGLSVQKGNGQPFRLIVSSSKDLAELMHLGGIDEEFFFMISAARVRVPSLEERADDMPKIAEALLSRVNKLLNNNIGFETKEFSSAALRFINTHKWSGNIYELYTTIKRAALDVDGKKIGYDDIVDAVILAPKQNYKDEQILNRPLGDGFDIYAVLMEVRRHYSYRALEQANNIKNEAADLLGLPNRQTLANWLEKFDQEEVHK
mgnify:CR=1 FL=1